MDYGSRYTERRERILDRRLSKVYLEAQKDLQKKLAAFTKKTEKENQKKLADLAAGKITDEEYRTWLSLKVFQSTQWRTKAENAAETLLQSNRKALTLIRDEQMNVFTENSNFEAYSAEKQTGVSFELYDVASVDRLVREKPELLPRKVVNGRKDKAWNQGNIANAITQGIIQGESVEKIAKRIARDTAEKNRSAMIRYARTAMTGAQNAGRIETMHRAEGLGLKVRKQWLATLDGRTRDAHRMLDGQEQDLDEPFQSELGDIMFPGDPHAAPGNVYNCRCTMISVYPKHEKAEWNGERRDQETGKMIQNMSYQEWVAMKEKSQTGKAALRREVDVTDQYKETARPKKGKLSYDKDLDTVKADAEIKIARWLRDTFGGNIHVRQHQAQSEGISYCDYYWRGKNWELKSPKNFKSPDEPIEKAIDQIRKNPGGIILDYQSAEFNLERIINGARKRMTTAGFDADLMILHKGKLQRILRYKK